jgi:lactate permease
MTNGQLPVDIGHWLLATVPIIVLLLLLVVFRWKGIEAGPTALFAAALVGLLAFRAPGETLAVAAAKGIWDAIFILYVVWTALLLYLITVRAGAFDALRRGFIEFSRNELFLVLAIGWVFSSFFQGIAGFGAPIAVVAPLLVGLGVRPVYAVIFPLIAHTWAKMFGTLAVGWLATVNVVDLADPIATAAQTAILLWIPNLLGGAVVAWMYGRMPALKHGLAFILIISLIHGGIQLGLMFINPILSNFIAGTVALVALYPLSRWKRYREPAESITERPAMREDVPLIHDQKPKSGEQNGMGLGLALLPYGILTVTALAALAIPAVEQALSQFRIGMPFPQVTTGFGMTREATDLYSPIRPLTHPGTFVLLASVISWLVYRSKGYLRPADKPEEEESLWVNLVKDSVPSSIAIASFLTMSKLMDHSGQTTVLAQGLAVVATPTIYAFAANWIGILGAFMTSSSTASNILFAPLQAEAVQALPGLSESAIIGAQGAGGAVGNVIAPANIVLGTTTAGIAGQEGEVLRKVLPWTLVVGVLVGIATIILNAL